MRTGCWVMVAEFRQVWWIWRNRWKARFWKCFPYFLCLWACSPEGLLLVQLWLLWNTGSEIQELWAEVEYNSSGGGLKYLNEYLNVGLFRQCSRSLKDFYILIVFWNLFLYVQYGFGQFSCSDASLVFRDVSICLLSFPLCWCWSVQLFSSVEVTVSV